MTTAKAQSEGPLAFQASLSANVVKEWGKIKEKVSVSIYVCVYVCVCHCNWPVVNYDPAHGVNLIMGLVHTIELFIVY